MCKTPNEVMSINLGSGCRIICSSNLLRFFLSDLVARLASGVYDDPIMSFWPILQVYEKSPLEVLSKPIYPWKDIWTDPLDDCSLKLNSYDMYDMLSCKSNEERDMVYLQVQTLQLASVVLHFDKLCFDKLQLNPLHCPSLPAYSYLAALNYTKVRFYYIKDERMINFINARIRGP